MFLHPTKEHVLNTKDVFLRAAGMIGMFLSMEVILITLNLGSFFSCLLSVCPALNKLVLHALFPSSSAFSAPEWNQRTLDAKAHLELNKRLIEFSKLD